GSAPPAEVALEEAAHPRRETGPPLRIRGATERVCDRRVGVDGAAERVDAEARGHGEDDLADRLAGVAGDQRGAQDASAAALEMEAREPLRPTLEHGAVDLLEGHREGGDVVAPLAGLRLRPADVRDLRLGVRAPRDDDRAHRLPAEEERLPEHAASPGVGRVGELVAGADVPRGVDAGVRGAEAIVDDQPRPLVAHTRGLEAESLDVGNPADGEEDGVATR